MAKHDPARTPLRARVLVTLGAAVLGLAVCEAAVRWGGFAPLPQPVFAGENFRALDDPVQRYDNLPGGEFSVTFVDAPGAQPRAVRALINADGGFEELTPADNKLSKRQKQLIVMLDRGLSNREIADELGISEHTVKVHLWRLFRRLGVKSRTQTIHYARTHGMLTS